MTYIYTYLCLLAGLSLLPACRSQLPQGYVRMPVYMGGEHALQVLLPADNQPGLEAASLLQQQHSLLLGRLSPPSHLLLERDSLLLTRIQMQEAVAIEAGFLHLSAADSGRYALVKGHWQGDVLYEAEMICLLRQPLTPALKRKLQNGRLSLEELCGGK